MKNPYLERRQARRKRAGLNAEQGAAQQTGGKVNAGSGALPWKKGDIQAGEDIKMESKSTKHRSLSLKREWLEKIEREAMDAEERPALAVVFTDEMGEAEMTWVAVPAWVFRELVDGS